MRFYTIALFCEAKPFIEHFALKKSDDKLFKIYENSDIKLIISGVGNINACLATTYMLTKYNASKEDFAFNFGIAGANFSCNIGDVFEVSKVIDFSSKSILLLPRKNENKAKKLTTVALPTVKIDIKNTLVDMEGYGFLKAAKKFIKSDENIMIKKVVSDFLEDVKLDKDQVSNFVKNILNKDKEVL